MRDRTPEEFVAAFNKVGSVKGVARAWDYPWVKTQRLYKAAVDAKLMAPIRQGRKTREELKDPTKASAPKPPSGRVRAIAPTDVPLPASGKINRFLFSCVQNDTLIHEQLWKNIQALMDHYRADPRADQVQLHVARIVYNKNGLAASGWDKARAFERIERYENVRELTWAPETEKFWSDHRLKIAPGLIYCGESNTIPTADRPLSGFESYTGRASGIFPHTKVQLQSIPSMASEGTKINYTTGALTLRNHIQRKAGLKADFHHCYGALLAEVDDEGNWWCRQIISDSAGTIHDLDIKVEDGVVTTGNTVEAIVVGDIHTAILDEECGEIMWGAGGMIDTLRPKHQIFHDLFNMTARNHHEIKDPVRRFQVHTQGQESVESECLQTRSFLEDYAERDWLETVIVNSNHDRAIGRWLKEQDGRIDPINMIFWNNLWRAVLEDCQGKFDVEPNYFALAMKMVGYQGNANFLERDASYVICEDDGGGIELGMHGDEGPNGSRGSANAFARMGRKMVVAHTHQAGITDGVYTVGTMSKLRPVYCHGPGSWSHTNCVIYPNGKRTLVTLWAGRYRA